MKKSNLLQIVIFLSSIFIFGFKFENYNLQWLYNHYPNTLFYPDVMGNVNVINYEGGILKNVTINLDSMPVFSGFPKKLSGSSFEGGIYCNMDSDPALEIVYNAGYSVNAFNYDGSVVPGWPKSISYPAEGAPAFGDIDGDGQGEIVVTGRGLTSGGNIWAFEKNGNTVTGFPVNHGYSTRTPVLADINNDGKMEIVVNLRTYPTGSMYVYKGDGTVYPGWPKAMANIPASSAAVGDINNDGYPEIIMETYYGIYAWTRNGDSIPGFPFMNPNGDVNSYSSPVLADVDGDNYREIIYGTHILGSGGYVYILKNNGTIMSGWPKGVGYWIYGPPAVGFIDNDNILDIAVGDQVVSFTPVDRIYAWNKNGDALSGFPSTPVNAINNQITLADINNDNLTELIIDDNTQTTSDSSGKYLCFKNDGTQLTSWILQTKGTTFFNTPALLDINRDNVLDMVGGAILATSFTNVYLWNLSVPYNPSKIQIPMWQYNTRHNGVYGDVNLTGISGNNTEVPKNFILYQNYPNPFNPVTKIKFSLPSNVKSEKSNVKLLIYDILGKEISALVNEQLPAGTYEVTFDGYNLTSGIYFYKLTAGEFIECKKMVLIK